MESTTIIPAPARSLRRRKRSAAQRAKDWAETERLALLGHTQAEIAAEISKSRPYQISRSQIQFDLAQLAKGWRESASEALATVKARQLRRLEVKSIEAWQAWEKSKGAETPNPQWLRVLVDIHDRVVRLLGLEAAARHELSGPGGGPVVLAADNHAALAPEQKTEILRRHLERLDQEQRAHVGTEPAETETEPETV